MQYWWDKKESNIFKNIKIKLKKMPYKKVFETGAFFGPFFKICRDKCDIKV